MKSRIALSSSLIKRIVGALPGVEGGKVVIDLGRFGTAVLAVDRIHIGQDLVLLPLSFHLRGNPDTGGVEVSLSLTNWQVRDGDVWFTLEKAGALRGALFRAAQGALHKLINAFIQRQGERMHLLRREDQLGIPVKAFLSRWGDPHLPIEVTAIEVKNGVVLHLS